MDIDQYINRARSELAEDKYPEQFQPLVDKTFEFSLEDLGEDSELNPNLIRNLPEHLYNLYSIAYMHAFTKVLEHMDASKLGEYAKEAIPELVQLKDVVKVSGEIFKVVQAIMNVVEGSEKVSELVKWLKLLLDYEEKFNLPYAKSRVALLFQKAQKLLIEQVGPDAKREGAEEALKQIIQIEDLIHQDKSKQTNLNRTKDIVAGLALNFLRKEGQQRREGLQQNKAVLSLVKALTGLREGYTGVISNIEKKFAEEVPPFNIKEIKERNIVMRKGNLVQSCDDVVKSEEENMYETKDLEIWKAHLKQKTHIHVAVKICKMKLDDEKTIKALKDEISIMDLLSGKGQCFLKYYGDFEDKFYDKESGSILKRIGMAMELCDGSLADLIKEKKNSDEPFTENYLKTAIQQLVNDFAYLHSQRIYHYDIKPQNIFLKDGTVFKIADFGISSKLEETTTTVRTIKLDSVGGTRGYMAPEIRESFGMLESSLTEINEEDEDDEESKSEGASSTQPQNPAQSDPGHTRKEKLDINPSKADVFSLGMAFYAMYFLEPNPPPMNKQQLKNKIKEIEYEWMQELLNRMLAYRRQDRPTMRELLGEMDFGERTVAPRR